MRRWWKQPKQSRSETKTTERNEKKEPTTIHTISYINNVKWRISNKNSCQWFSFSFVFVSRRYIHTLNCGMCDAFMTVYLMLCSSKFSRLTLFFSLRFIQSLFALFISNCVVILASFRSISMLLLLTEQWSYRLGYFVFDITLCWATFTVDTDKCWQIFDQFMKKVKVEPGVLRWCSIITISNLFSSPPWKIEMFLCYEQFKSWDWCAIQNQFQLLCEIICMALNKIWMFLLWYVFIPSVIFSSLCVSLCACVLFSSSLNHTGVCKYRFNCVYYLLLAFFSFPSAFTEIICLITVTYKLIQTPKKQQRNNAHLTRRAYMWVCIRNVYSFYSIHFFPFITEITKIICIHISEHNFDEAGS